MPRDPELIKLRDQRIREVYERMRSARMNGKPKYQLPYILEVISTRHVFISTRSIERVLFGR